MRTLEERITQYAAYHRDRRNIATHFVGIPLIVFSVTLALSVWSMPLGSIALSAAIIAAAVAGIYYLKLDFALGVAMAVYLALNCVLAQEMAAMLGTANSLWAALIAFVVGWALQFWGHKFEGMKPAFVDDIMGLVIGPLFIMTEVFFMLGLKSKLKQYVEARVGPVVARREHQAT
ncbi:MAG: DUF962 domain-containing protein [Betaproteobacteria bacterium]|nr:DUF962 domain-containing protein [Betaproteobacteria bacterium]